MSLCPPGSGRDGGLERLERRRLAPGRPAAAASLLRADDGDEHDDDEAASTSAGATRAERRDGEARDRAGEALAC